MPETLVAGRERETGSRRSPRAKSAPEKTPESRRKLLPGWLAGSLVGWLAEPGRAPLQVAGEEALPKRAEATAGTIPTLSPPPPPPQFLSGEASRRPARGLLRFPSAR